ncbi:MAG TPA: TIGR01212 family radical SAM protein [Pseudobacteroides sp.]|uniref:TIGR01212 family radical SAM protein n=1 Tax=Pseudobacteroides sp. TaxID=1968840 RepID=UPI002F92D28F
MYYNKFSDYLKEKYKAKVYKIPINIPVTCPNRDGTLGTKGCLFCGEEGAGFENLSNQLGVREQIEINSRYIGEKYKAEKFIIYFQNYTNTYLPVERFKAYISDSCMPGVAAIYISTRPDCINDSYLSFLQSIKNSRNIDIVIELGLQTVNYHTLKAIYRGHLLAEFIDAAIRIKNYGLMTCAHYIVDLPMDNMDDVIEGARIISALGVNQVKCHSMYILEGTGMGDLYKKGLIKPVTLEEYIERVIAFLEFLSPEIVIQRLIGRAPKERSLFCNWGTSWWKIHDMIEAKMKEENRCQGLKFNYLNGSACQGLF